MRSKSTALAAICRRCFALLLAVLLLLGCACAEVTAHRFDNGSSDEKLDVYVRVFVPGSKSPGYCVGHYDLMIKGRWTVKGKTLVNPVFSYRMEDSRLDIFSEKDTSRMYAHGSGDYYRGCSIYQMHLKIGNQDKLKDFLSSLGSIVSSVSAHPNCSRALKCSIKSRSAFSSYRMDSTNCFFAVATWTKALGYNGLMKLYKDVHAGRADSYMPAVICRQYSSKLRYVRKL